MKLLHGFDEPSTFQGGYFSIGNFDGVHRGHQTMVARLIERARAASVPAVVMTFSPHPIALLRPAAAPAPLTNLDRKAELLGQCGVDYVIGYPTDWELLNLGPDEFFQSIIVTKLQAKGLVEGENFFYGHNRAGNVTTLAQSCQAAGLTLDVITPVAFHGRIVSSSVIRGLIAQGAVADAAELLGTFYRIRGRVTTGLARGRTLGFPTANLTEIDTEIPPDGVYSARCLIGGGAYRAAVNLGTNPTFAENHRKFEVHILDFQGDLYGHSITIDFVTRLRETIAFQSVEQLVHQLQTDVAAVRQVVQI
ncbi:MAG: riboflavin kinase [Planctomycetaceae bacterium]|nr:riboflavin kinase [Planctomycetaceae bacterium]